MGLHAVLRKGVFFLVCVCVGWGGHPSSIVFTLFLWGPPSDNGFLFSFFWYVFLSFIYLGGFLVSAFMGYKVTFLNKAVKLLNGAVQY